MLPVTTVISQDPGWDCAARIGSHAVPELTEIHHVSRVKHVPVLSRTLATSESVAFLDLRDEGEKVCCVADWTKWLDGQFLNSTNHDTPEPKCLIWAYIWRNCSVCTVIWRTSVHYDFVFYIRERYILAYSMVNPWSAWLCCLWWIGCHMYENLLIRVFFLAHLEEQIQISVLTYF